MAINGSIGRHRRRRRRTEKTQLQQLETGNRKLENESERTESSDGQAACWRERAGQGKAGGPRSGGHHNRTSQVQLCPFPKRY